MMALLDNPEFWLTVYASAICIRYVVIIDGRSRPRRSARSFMM
jgi:hypothetical protein